MAKVKVTLTRSLIDRSKKQKRTVNALGLTKMHQSRTHEETDQIKGMINKVKHLLKVESV